MMEWSGFSNVCKRLRVEDDYEIWAYKTTFISFIIVKDLDKEILHGHPATEHPNKKSPVFDGSMEYCRDDGTIIHKITEGKRKRVYTYPLCTFEDTFRYEFMEVLDRDISLLHDLREVFDGTKPVLR
jgi:hypothetical protein